MTTATSSASLSPSGVYIQSPTLVGTAPKHSEPAVPSSPPSIHSSSSHSTGAAPTPPTTSDRPDSLPVSDVSSSPGLQLDVPQWDNKVFNAY
uniref:Uncharacterized protein n=1 Tax=Nelumbo nucifera TaxID=4432 RepID=A0A822YMC3_NELNU|nr:TPA_asm: hypothetical protein HUJ06_012523 [Nelumbo nucifera]